MHHLRYLLAYGHGSSDALSLQGHAYLTLITPLIGIGVVLVSIELLYRVATAVPDRNGGTSRSSFLLLWIIASGCLLATYSVQELVEGGVSTGHPGGVAGVLGHGGWVSILLSAAIGALVALAHRGAIAVLERASRRLRRPKRSPGVTRRLPSLRINTFTPDVLALNLAPRAPPPTA